PARKKPPEGTDASHWQITLELRCAPGNKTTIPPSLRGGEQLVWGSFGKPAPVCWSTIYKAVHRLAAAVLLLRYWPSQGGRHDFAMHLGGGLANLGVPVEEAAALVEVVATHAGDDEADDRVQTLRDSYAARHTGARHTGWPSVIKALGEHGKE